MIELFMIEDDEELAEIIAESLEEYDIKVTNFSNPINGLEYLKNYIFDLVILDLSLPEIDGLEVIKFIREFSNIPIIISSARDDFDDKNIAFNYGADDYLSKPYDIRELVLRIKALIKRYDKPNEMFEIIDDFIYQNGKKIDLTRGEFSILKILIENRGQIIRKEELLIDFDSDLKAVEVLVSRIRKKIDKNCIKTIRGLGYEFVC